MIARQTVASLFVLALLIPNTASAQDSAADKIKKLTTDISKILKENMQTSVSIGDITGPPSPSTAAGPGIAAILIAELAKEGITVDPKAFFGMKGEYFPVEEEAKKDQLIVRIEITIRNVKTGKSFGTINQILDSNANVDLAKILGVTASLPAKATPERRNEIIKEAISDPTPPATIGTVAKVDPKGRFGVEVLTRNAGGTLTAVKPTVNENKELVIDLEKGCEYVLKLQNNSPHEAAANITIDGLDVFQFFQPADKKPQNFILGAGTTAAIEGWVFGFDAKKAQATYRTFLVTDFANSAAGKELAKNADTAAYATLKSNPKIGTITVCFHPCWEEGKAPAEYAGSRSVADNATGVGKEVKGTANKVQRTVGQLLEVITIRYKK
jgi:hypothetical protein